MGFEYIIGAIIVIASIIGIVKVISMNVEPIVCRKGNGGTQPLTDAGPKPAIKKKPIPKKICSSDWDGNGSNGGSYF